MKSLLVILIAWLIVVPGSAQDASTGFDFGKDRLSNKWTAGPALVYDCDDQHWVCTSPFDYSNCGRTRQDNLMAGKHLLGCLPANVFESSKDCQGELARLVVQGAYPRLCLHPSRRQSVIGFR